MRSPNRYKPGPGSRTHPTSRSNHSVHWLEPSQTRPHTWFSRKGTYRGWASSPGRTRHPFPPREGEQLSPYADLATARIGQDDNLAAATNAEPNKRKGGDRPSRAPAKSSPSTNPKRGHHRTIETQTTQRHPGGGGDPETNEETREPAPAPACWTDEWELQHMADAHGTTHLGVQAIIALAEEYGERNGVQ